MKTNSIGIEKEYFDRIFTIFQRLHTKIIKALELDFQLLKKIIECHGGRIWAESNQGVGSTFYFTIHVSK
jgi:light-regulated signal transduction histidine kinase (bacteriophytochrome)